jgi:hypothetical protein
MATVNGVAPKDDPSTASGDYNAMCDGWDMISDILAGAAHIKKAGTKYLPKFQKESTSAYDLRKASAPWRPEFEDALRSLCSKPFTKTVSVNEDAPDVIQGKVVDDKTKERKGGLVDDIDGQGNSLHVFARDTFWHGVGFGLEAIYVTYPEADGVRTKADEQKAGLRPYWVHVRARDIIDLKLTSVGGRTLVSQIRIKECTKEADGFAEVERERIRFLQLTDKGPVWTLYLKGENGVYAVEKGPFPFVGQDEIPIALFFTGPRSGNYRVKPPMLDLAVMQIEIYRRMSRHDQIETLAGSPMLVGSGFAPPAPTQTTDAGGRVIDVPAPQIEVGPGVVLFAPPSVDGVQPSWEYIQPEAGNMTALQDSVDQAIEDFRRLAMQPTTPQSGNMVATGQAIDAAKSHTAVEAWANGLADALNQAWVYTTKWLKLADTITVSIFTDFGADAAGVQEAQVLGTAASTGVISKKRNALELARRNILGPDYNYDQDQEQMAEEQQGLESEQEIDPVTGKPVDPNADPKAPLIAA